MDLVHSQVPETNTGRPQHRGQESNLRPSGSEPDATTSSCYPGMLFSITEHGWKELNPHTTASKAAGLPLADTRMLFTGECHVGVEPTSPGWKLLQVASRSSEVGKTRPALRQSSLAPEKHLCRSVKGTLQIKLRRQESNLRRDD